MSGDFTLAADASVNMSAGSAGAVGSGAYTIAVLVRPTTGNNNCGFLRCDASGTQQRGFFEDALALFGANDFSSGFGALTQGNWYVVVQSKAAGSNLFRFHLWAYASDGSGSMSHGTSTGGANQGDGSTIDAVRIGIADDRGNGLIAAVGLWTSALSDGQLDTLKSANLSAWSALSPAELISLENWNGSTGCTAVVGTSSQSSITGTVGVGANPPSFNFALTAASIPFNPQRSTPQRDTGEVQWLQRDRRDNALVATAANDLDIPLLAAEHQRSVYGHSVMRDRRTAPQQRNYYDPSLLTPAVTMPSPTPQRTTPARDYGEAQWLQPARRDLALLATALLENELLGGAETAKRAGVPTTHTDRREVPQQRIYYDASLLATAQLENELLGGAQTAKRTSLPATHTDRREVPQQRQYISDPSAYPTVAPVDPLTVAWGAGGTYWHLYNDVRVERRVVPQQRSYKSPPGLLDTAQLDELLGSADTARHYLAAATHASRRLVPQQRQYFDLSLLLTALLEVPYARAGQLPTDRRATVSQPRMFDLSLLVPVVEMLPPPAQRTPPVRDYGDAQWLQPARRNVALLATALLENELLGGADTDKRTKVPATHADRREVPQQRQYFDLTLLATALLESPLVWVRPQQAISDRREVPQQRRYISDPSFYPFDPTPIPGVLVPSQGGPTLTSGSARSGLSATSARSGLRAYQVPS